MGYNIRVVDVWFSYTKGEYILRGINLEARKGEITVIIGPTGCGKSTLLLIIAGLLKPEKGIVYYNNKPLNELLPGIRRDIGILFQDPDDHLFNPTVFDEIAFSLRSLGVKENEIREKVRYISELLKIQHLLNRSSFKLSVGEKKKVALASILVYEPKVLLLDEPSANLDSKTLDLVKNIILKAKSEGKTLIITSCDLDFAIQIADRIYAINNGRIKVNCKVEEFLNDKVFQKIDLHQPLLYKVLTELGIDPKIILRIVRSKQQ